jgi:hypothetical protein
LAHAEDLENPVNHKLHLITRADIAAGQLVLEVTGCLTQANYLILLKRLHQLRRRLGDGTITVDVRDVRHLDPDVLLSLRRRAEPGGMEPVQLHLAEPAELPICLAHVGPDGEVLAHLNGHSGSRRHAGILSGSRPKTRARASGRKAARKSGSGRPRTIVELSSEIYDGTLDPETTVRALSEAALELLVDALYRHLDSPAPSFGAYTWYELATDELQNRRDEEERAHPALPQAAAAAGRAGREAVTAGGPVRRVAARSRR